MNSLRATEMPSSISHWQKHFSPVKLLCPRRAAPPRKVAPNGASTSPSKLSFTSLPLSLFFAAHIQTCCDVAEDVKWNSQLCWQDVEFSFVASSMCGTCTKVFTTVHKLETTHHQKEKWIESFSGLLQRGGKESQFYKPGELIKWCKNKKKQSSNPQKTHLWWQKWLFRA